MKKFRVSHVLYLLVAVAICWPTVRSANGYLTFSRVFVKKYTGDKSTDNQKALEKEFKRVKCSVCHDPRPGEDGKVTKKNRNPYGQALNKLLTKKDQKDEAKILEALTKVENEKAQDIDKTFGEQLSAGKLPFLYEGFDYSAGKDDEADKE